MMRDIPISKKVLSVSCVVGLLCLTAAGQAAGEAQAAKGASPSTKTASTAHHSATTKSKVHSASSRTSSRKGKRSKKSSWRRGQQKIDSERTRQIQEALVRDHYLSSQPTGKWDAATEEALRRYQADNGWQNKTVPDSRALIKLGLGPNHDHLLNPESAMTTAPQAARATSNPADPGANGLPAAGSSQPQP